MAAKGPMPLEELLAQAGWAKALARSLARDDDSADELVQRAWVAALRRPPEGAAAPATLRRWLASVMRNFARQDAREHERRTTRERLVARPERSSGEAPDAVEGLEAQRRLLAALSSLPDPYRATLFARYFEAAMPREIARRTGVPVKTVKSQLARGLTLLRAKLDREHGGDRGAWLVWVLPMAATSAAPTALLGALILDSKLKVTGALLALVSALAVGTYWLRDDAGLPEAPPVQAAQAARLEPPKDLPRAPSPAEPVERVAVDGSAEAPAVHPARGELASAGPVRGRVLDLENRPVGFVRIVFEARDPIQSKRLAALPPLDVRSDAAGWFEIAAPPRSVNLLVEDPRWVTVYKAYIAGGSVNEATIFVAAQRTLGGIVVDPEHQPIEGAEVDLRLADSVKRNLERTLDGAYRQNFVAKTDAAGRFSMPEAPACESMLRAVAPGFDAATLAAPALDATDLVLVLGARERRSAVVAGIVVDEEGRPVEGARVAVGAHTQVTESDGRFVFDLDALEDPDPVENVAGVWRPKFTRDAVRAVKFGYLPAEQALPTADELRADLAPREFRLVLVQGALEIRGRVVEADGTGVGGARITVLDETPFGMILERVGEADVGRDASLEQMLRGGPLMRIAGSSRDGRFLVQGLTARGYDLAALDAQTLRYAIVRGVQAGKEDVRIELPPIADLVHVAGRVVSNDGQGVAGIDLHVGRMPEGAAWPDFVRLLSTDEQGRFDLGSLDPEFLRIQVLGENIFLIMAWQPPKDAKLDALEIVVSQRCPVKVELTPTAPRADAFSFLDGAGRPTQNFQFEGPMISLPERCALADGVSEVYATEDTARTLVLYLEGAEVARIPVRLAPGQVTILRP